MQERELMPAGSGPKEDDPSYAKLPTEIEDALDAFEADTALRDLLGEEFVKGLCRHEASGSGAAA